MRIYRAGWGSLLIGLAGHILLEIVFVCGCTPTPRPATPAPTLPPKPGSLAGRQGAAHQLGPLYFDPQRADFTAWIIHFKDQVYRNWVIPRSVADGASGYVELEFTVQRDGSLSRLEIVQSSATPDLDNAAVGSLRESRFLALPTDFPSSQVIMRVSYWCNAAPKR